VRAIAKTTQTLPRKRAAAFPPGDLERRAGLADSAARNSAKCPLYATRRFIGPYGKADETVGTEIRARRSLLS